VTTATATTTMQIDLTGKRALVSGGTRGIGKGITDRLRAAGATVVVAARTAPHTPSPQVITADIATVDGSQPSPNAPWRYSAVWTSSFTMSVAPR